VQFLFQFYRLSKNSEVFLSFLLQCGQFCQDI
jgi:hypothetical protein